MAALCNMQLEGKRGQGFCSVVLVCSLYLQGDSLSPTFGVFLGPALGLIKLRIPLADTVIRGVIYFPASDAQLPPLVMSRGLFPEIFYAASGR